MNEARKSRLTSGVFSSTTDLWATTATYRPPSCAKMKYMCMKESKKIIVYDDYNSNIPKDQNVIGTVTTMFGRDSLRHGYKIIEIYEQ